MSEALILNPYSKTVNLDKSLLLVVALDLSKKWYPLAKKFGSYKTLEGFQDVVLNRLLNLEDIALASLEGYVKHLAKKNISQPSEVLVEDFEVYDFDKDFSPSTVKTNKGIESFWFNWLDSLRTKPLKPLKNEEELLYLLKAVLILRFIESKGLTEKSTLDGDTQPIRYRTWWSQFLVSLVGRVGLPTEEVEKRVSLWLSYYLQCEKALIEASLLYLKVEGSLVDNTLCYTNQPIKTRMEEGKLIVRGTNFYTIYKVEVQSYVDRLFDYYFGDSSVSHSFRLDLGSQTFYNIPYKGYVLKGNLEELILETLASWLVLNFDCRFIGVVGSTMYLEFKEDSGSFPVFLVYFKEVFQFELFPCGKEVKIES
jgi:hypothetical protein